MDLAGRKLGLLLSTPPGHPNLYTAAGISRAALDRGAGLYLYLIDDGVSAMDKQEIQELVRRGAKLFVCAYACQRRRIQLIDPDRFNYCGLVTLTDLINGCDRFLAFN